MAQQPPVGQGLLNVEDSWSLRHTTLGRTPLNEWSARRRDLYLITHNTHNRQTIMPPVRFKPTILASERPQTHASDRAAIGIGFPNLTPRTVFKIALIFQMKFKDRI